MSRTIKIFLKLDNPVFWFPWNKKTLKKAKIEKKPIFLINPEITFRSKNTSIYDNTELNKGQKVISLKVKKQLY